MELRKSCLIFLCASVAFSINANNEQLKKNMPTFEVSTTIQPGARQEVTNPVWFDIGAKCKVDTKGQNINFKIEIIEGIGSVNGKHYSAPNVLNQYPVGNGESFNVKISGGAKAALTLIQDGNTKAIDARCDVQL